MVGLLLVYSFRFSESILSSDTSVKCNKVKMRNIDNASMKPKKDIEYPGHTKYYISY